MEEMGSGNVQLNDATSLEGCCSANLPRASALGRNCIVRLAGVVVRKLTAILNRLYRHPGRAVAIFLLLLFIAGGVGIASAYLWASYHLRAARSDLARYHTNEALPHLHAALSIWPRDAETLLLSARAARRMEAFDRADRYLDLYQEVRGADDQALVFERILIHADRGDIDSVSAYCHDLIKQDHPDSPLILESLTRGYLRMYRLHEADLCLQEWIRRQPDSPQALLMRAQLCDLQGRSSDALDDYRHVLTIDAEMDDVRLRLCTALMQLGSILEALPHLKYLSQRLPGNPIVQVYLARVYDRQGDTKEAETLLDSVLERYPQFPPALAERGKLALRAGQNDLAEKCLREAITLDPSDHASHYQYLLCLERNSKLEELQKEQARMQSIEQDIHLIQQISTVRMQQSPHDPNLHYQVGAISLRAGTAQEALRWFYSALREDPNHAPTHKALMEYYESIGDYGRAQEHRQKARLGGAVVPEAGDRKKP